MVMNREIIIFERFQPSPMSLIKFPLARKDISGSCGLCRLQIVLDIDNVSKSLRQILSLLIPNHELDNSVPGSLIILKHKA